MHRYPGIGACTLKWVTFLSFLNAQILKNPLNGACTVKRGNRVYIYWFVLFYRYLEDITFRKLNIGINKYHSYFTICIFTLILLCYLLVEKSIILHYIYYIYSALFSLIYNWRLTFTNYFDLKRKERSTNNLNMECYCKIKQS